jgi:hypothetical protein
MVYSDDTGRRIRLRVKRRTAPAATSAADDSLDQYVRQVATENPRFTPAEVHAEIRYRQGRTDISIDVVRSILG